MRFTRATLPAELARCDEWPTVDLSSLTPAERERMGEIRGAIEAYLGGECVAGRLRTIRMSHAELLRRMNRCASFDGAGRLVGWKALLPCERLVEYTRKEPTTARDPLSRGGYSGALGRLFTLHPALRERLERYVITGRRDGDIPDARVTAKSAHEYFLALCKEYGIVESEWPFCVESLGERALGAWVKRFSDRNYDRIVLRQHGRDAKAKSATGLGVPSRLKASLPFDIVEMDEHTFDFIGSVIVPTPKGNRYVAMKRLVIILIVDRFSQAALGYQVIARRKVNSADILKTVALALTPWAAREMYLQDFTGSLKGGFPSAKIPSLASCGFGMLLMDNDSAHLAEAFLSRIGHMAGCAINYGKVAHFERRPIIESLNGRIESAGFHRLPSTTGSDPADCRRQDAEAKAVKHKIHLDALLDLVEGVVAEHNASHPGGNFGMTPLEVLQQYVDDERIGFLPPVLPPVMPGMPPLGLSVELVTVGGSRERGDRPHIMLDRGRYEAPWLSRRIDLIGRVLVAHINESEISVFHVVSRDNTVLGNVSVVGPFAGHPHSREARRLINACVKRGQIMERSDISVYAQWSRLLTKEALSKSGTKKHPTSSRAGNQLAQEELLGHRITRAADDVNGNVTSEVASPDPTDVPPDASLPLSLTVAIAAEEKSLVPNELFFAIN